MIVTTRAGVVRYVDEAEISLRARHDHWTLEQAGSPLPGIVLLPETIGSIHACGMMALHARTSSSRDRCGWEWHAESNQLACWQMTDGERLYGLISMSARVGAALLSDLDVLGRGGRIEGVAPLGLLCAPQQTSGGLAEAVWRVR